MHTAQSVIVSAEFSTVCSSSSSRSSRSTINANYVGQIDLHPISAVIQASGYREFLTYNLSPSTQFDVGSTPLKNESTPP